MDVDRVYKVPRQRVRRSHINSKQYPFEDQFSTYNLPRKRLMYFLQNFFGPGNFEVEIKADYYWLRLPRALTPEQRDMIDESKDNVEDIYDEPGHHESHHSKGPVSDSEHNSSSKQTPGLEKESVSHQKFDSKQGSDFKKVIDSNLEHKDKVKEFKSTSYQIELKLSVPQSRGDKEIHLIIGEDRNQRGVSAFLYRSSVAIGVSSEVYEVDARWGWVSEERPQSLSKETKLAIKKLDRKITRSQFEQEYKALKSVTSGNHPNIIEFFEAFSVTDTTTTIFNFCFPLAVGTLKALFYSRHLSHETLPNSGPIRRNVETHQFSDNFIECASQKLWSQFEGLASAVEYLHETCEIVHTDIKPSNILLYQLGEDSVVAKLTDFGLAVKFNTRETYQLGSAESIVSNEMAAPELRGYFLHNADKSAQANTPAVLQPDASSLKAGDIWKLGSVFAELLSFLVCGGDGVANFHDFITTVNKEVKSDRIDDTRFDDGVKVKGEVIDWLELLSAKNIMAKCIIPLVKQMLSTSPERPPAAIVLRSLKKAGSEIYMIAGRLFLIQSSKEIEELSYVDSAKEWLEKKLRHQIDWRPFPNGRRSCKKGHSRLTWMYGSIRLSEDFPDSVVRSVTAGGSVGPTTYHSGWSGGVPGSSGLRSSATSNPRQSTSVQTPQPDHNNNTDQPMWAEKERRSRLHKTSRDKPTEIYWCVDRVWTEALMTSLRTIPKAESLDDKGLCEVLKKMYSEMRSWRRAFSWKSCQDVQFVHFSRWKWGQGQVNIIAQGQLPPSDQSPPYYYEIPAESRQQFHMRRIAKEIIAVMYQPEDVGDTKDAISGIPKKLIGASSNGDDWGIYAVSKLSLWKVMVGTLAINITVYSLMFFWLAIVDGANVASALIAGGMIGSTLFSVLAIPQLLNLD